jgi:hypothetical protein
LAIILNSSGFKRSFLPPVSSSKHTNRDHPQRALRSRGLLRKGREFSGMEAHERRGRQTWEEKHWAEPCEDTGGRHLSLDRLSSRKQDGNLKWQWDRPELWVVLALKEALGSCHDAGGC